MKVVGIHGIHHDYLTAPQIEHEWLLALQGGLELAGKRIERQDFTSVGYGDLFRSSGTRAASIPPLRPEDIQEEWYQELLLKLWNEAAALSAENRSEEDELGEDGSIQDPNFQGRGRTPEVIQRALIQLSKSRYFRAWGSENVLIFGLKQVRYYLYNHQELKYKILQRVTDKVSKETKVIIGHSLGSVVAYEALCANPEWNVHTLVTLGSPLGIPNLIFDALTPTPENGRGVWPNVKQWFNIADKGDIVALEKKLAPHFGSVIDQLVHNGWESHNVKNYLTAKETGFAVATGLFE